MIYDDDDSSFMKLTRVYTTIEDNVPMRIKMLARDYNILLPAPWVMYKIFLLVYLKELSNGGDLDETLSSLFYGLIGINENYPSHWVGEISEEELTKILDEERANLCEEMCDLYEKYIRDKFDERIFEYINHRKMEERRYELHELRRGLSDTVWVTIETSGYHVLRLSPFDSIY